MNNELLAEAEQKMQAAYEHLQDELKRLRTNRASTEMVADIMVEQYGQQMPIKSLANISTPDAKTVTISPWDESSLEAIEKALNQNDTLGTTPKNDGQNIYLNIPPMTEERRTQTVKKLKEKTEQCHISLRNGRHEALQQAKDLREEGDLSEDEYHRLQDQLDEKISDFNQQVEEVAEDKEAEIMEV